MVNNCIHVRVTNVGVKSDKTYFSRIIKDAGENFDVNLVMRALQMLFSSELFKISVETYGA